MQENLYTSNSDCEIGTPKKRSKKKDIYIYVKAVLFVILIIPLFYYFGNKYSAASTENLINTYNEKRWNEFYSLTPNSVDVIFLGSSHSYCTFDPDIFDNALGTSSYQMGMPSQVMDSTYFTLLEVLNYQKPKVAVVEVYWDMIDDDFEIKQAGMLFQVLKNKELEQQYIKEVFPLSEKVKYNVKLFKYQQDYFAFKNKELKDKVKAKFDVYDVVAQKQSGIQEYRSKGYTYCNYNMLPDEFDKTNQFKNFDGKNWSISKNQKKYLQNIVDKCRENNIELIFVTAPVANVSMDYIKNYNYVHNIVAEFADKNGIEYIDYNIINEEEKLLTNENFRDDAHLNHSGVEIVDKHFTAILKKYL